jgi:nucleoside-diphosphate-sugar epimerase
MSVTIFLAGATGAIGQRLTPLLLRAGYAVHGLTRDAAKGRELEARGVRAVVADIYDAPAIRAALSAARPEIVVHQLTDLPQQRAESAAPEALERNARIRIEGTRNLVDAALACGATSLVSQSIAFVYAPGPEPHVESDPLDPARESVLTLERLTLESPPLAGAVLRFGMLYGPNTWFAEPSGNVPVHVDAAAWATLLAIEQSATGTFNVAEERGYVSSARARDVLGWGPALRVED